MAEQIDLTSSFTDAEWGRAQNLASTDPRLAEAVQQGRGRAVAATLANAPELIRRWRHGSDAYGKAVISAAIDARRCGHPDPLPTTLLESLAQEYLTGQQRATADPQRWFVEAISWAQTPVRGEIAPITIDAVTIGQMAGYRVSDILVDAATGHEAQPISERTWALIAELSTPAACGSIAWTARIKGLGEAAETAARRGADAGNALSQFILGALLHARGELTEARQLYHQAIAAGNRHALNGLAILLALQGDVVNAEKFYRRAIKAGDGSALCNLASLRRVRGDLVEAEQLYRQALDKGEDYALNGLANLLADRGEADDLVEAERLYRQAIDAEDGHALNGLANLLAKRDDVVEAERLYREVLAAPDNHNLSVLTDIAPRAYALNGLANLLADRDHKEDKAQAEQLYREAIAAREPHARSNLALLLFERGELAAAEQIYGEARDAGDSNFPPGNLAILLAIRGDLVAAEPLYRQAMAAGDPTAPCNLASLLAERSDEGDEAEAEQLYRQAIAADYPPAFNGLANLLARRGEGLEAERFYRQGVDAGDPSALYCLAKFLVDRGHEGDVAEAKQLYLQARASGHAFAAAGLAEFLANWATDNSGQTPIDSNLD